MVCPLPDASGKKSARNWVQFTGLFRGLGVASFLSFHPGSTPPAWSNQRDKLMSQDSKNQLLAALSAADLKLLTPDLKAMTLTQGIVLLEQGQRIDYCYFPSSGMVSLVSILKDGSSIEVGAVGHEGVVGVALADGTGEAPVRAIVQVAGQGARIPVNKLQAALDKSYALRRIIDHHSEALLAQIVRTVGCNAMHAAEARLSRWLLMVHDRVEGNTIRLTQEFLGQMLGVQRTTVTLVARSLQNAGLIKYRRGRIDVVDRKGLEEMACECYETNRKHFDRLMSLPSSRAAL
jgi:CRP-like cAMP-binding protein